MSSLEDIIDLPTNLEVKRALAVKMILFDFKTDDICALLNVSDSFVSKWVLRGFLWSQLGWRPVTRLTK